MNGLVTAALVAANGVALLVDSGIELVQEVRAVRASGLAGLGGVLVVAATTGGVSAKALLTGTVIKTVGVVLAVGGASVGVSTRDGVT